MNSQKMNAYHYLNIKYPPNECVILSEVSDSSWRRRSLDHMVINLWESRGQPILGFEVKSHRGDWLNELKKPEKQELHVPYCDYFYLLTMDEKVAKMEEIPDNWGWMTLKGDKLFIMKKAPKLEAKPIPKSLMVSMLRRAADRSSYVHRDSLQSEINDIVEKRVQAELQRNAYKRDSEIENYKDLKQSVENFQLASGIEIPMFDYSNNSKKMGEAVKFLMQNDPNKIINNLNQVKQISEALLKNAELGITSIEQYKNDINI